MTISIVISFCFIHWFADFVLQTDWQAKNKSKNLNALLQHTSIYSAVWFAIGMTLATAGKYDVLDVVLFVVTTFLFHTVTDHFTSRLNTYLWNKGKVHEFFVSVGFDQFLHYTQLFLTFWILN